MGVISIVLVEVGCAVRVVVGVLEGLLPPGIDFLGALVGLGVGEDGLVGQVNGFFVGFNVGDGVNIAASVPAGVVGIRWVGKGVYAGWVGLE